MVQTAVQSSYSERQRAGFVGQIANMESYNSITRQAEEAIAFGVPAVRGAADDGLLNVDSYVLAAAAAARAGNTGNATITASPAVAAGTKVGTWVLTALEPATDDGEFELTDPDGVSIGTASVGDAATLGGIGPFTIADGSTDVAAGDQFEIVVSASAGGGEFQGITIRDITLVALPGQTVDRYQSGDNVGLLTRGVIWVTAGAGGVGAGDRAYFNPATGRFTANDDHFPIPNAYFDTTGADGDLVKLRVQNL